MLLAISLNFKLLVARLRKILKKFPICDVKKYDVFVCKIMISPTINKLRLKKTLEYKDTIEGKREEIIANDYCIIKKVLTL